MTKWQQRIAQFDRSSLEDLSNPGLLRRASKLVETHKVVLEQLEDDFGQFIVGDNQVRLFVKFPDQIQCNCKTAGVCVHVLAAVLFEQQSETVSDGDNSDELTADELLDEMFKLDQRALFKWSGKTGRKQAQKIFMALPDKSPQLDIQQRSVAIALDDDIRCRYVAGGDLAATICDAPDSRKKGVILACLLAFKADKGEEINWPEDSSSSPAAKLTQAEKQLLNDIKEQINRLLQDGVMHLSKFQVGAMRNLAWSARGETLPRVAAQVLQLAGAMEELRNRSAKVETEYLLALVTEIWMECDKLLNASPDQLGSLRGQYRRNYEKKQLGRLWMVGASQYTSFSGAKGVSTAFWDIDNDASYRVNIGRSAETSHSLDTDSVWDTALPWSNSRTIGQLSGEIIKLKHSKVSDDGRISLSKETAVESIEKMEQVVDNINVLGIKKWSQLKQQFESQMLTGKGLFSTYLLRPTSIAPFEFDHYEQQWSSVAKDEDDQSIKLCLAENDINTGRVKRLNKLLNSSKKLIWGLVVESRLESNIIKLSPLSALIRDGQQWVCFSPDYELYRKTKGLSSLLKLISNFGASKLGITQKEKNTQTGDRTLIRMQTLLESSKELILAAAELGVDCDVNDKVKIEKIVADLTTVKANYIAETLTELFASLNTEKLLLTFYVLSQATLRFQLENTIWTAK